MLGEEQVRSLGEECLGKEVHQEEELQVGVTSWGLLASTPPERSLHLILVLHQTVLEDVTLDVEELVLRRPGDRQRGQRSDCHADC